MFGDWVGVIYYGLQDGSGIWKDEVGDLLYVVDELLYVQDGEQQDLGCQCGGGVVEFVVEWSFYEFFWLGLVRVRYCVCG